MSVVEARQEARGAGLQEPAHDRRREGRDEIGPDVDTIRELCASRRG